MKKKDIFGDNLFVDLLNSDNDDYGFYFEKKDFEKNLWEKIKNFPENFDLYFQNEKLFLDKEEISSYQLVNSGALMNLIENFFSIEDTSFKIQLKKFKMKNKDFNKMIINDPDSNFVGLDKECKKCGHLLENDDSFEYVKKIYICSNFDCLTHDFRDVKPYKPNIDSLIKQIKKINGGDYTYIKILPDLVDTFNKKFDMDIEETLKSECDSCHQDTHFPICIMISKDPKKETFGSEYTFVYGCKFCGNQCFQSTIKDPEFCNMLFGFFDPESSS